MKQKSTYKTGFTLVELSIVLVIIGLLVGGILVAQSLIDSARVNRIHNEITQYHIFAQQFQSRFKYLPGDYPRAFQIFGSTCGANRTNTGGNSNGGCNGNGNGFISQNNPRETYIFWEHLSLAGFLDEPFTGNGAAPADGPGTGNSNSAVAGVNAPALQAMNASGIRHSYPAVISAAAPRAGSSSLKTNYSLAITAPSASSCNFNCNAVLTSKLVFPIDVKFDDGITTSGIIVSQGGTGGTDFTSGCDYLNEDAPCKPFFHNPPELGF